MHNEKVGVQCDCPSKWKEGAGSWWEAAFLPFFHVQGFMDVLEWVSMKDCAIQSNMKELSAHHFAIQGPRLS